MSKMSDKYNKEAMFRMPLTPTPIENRMKPGATYLSEQGYSMEDTVLALTWLLAEMRREVDHIRKEIIPDDYDETDPTAEIDDDLVNAQDHLKAASQSISGMAVSVRHPAIGYIRAAQDLAAESP